MDFWEKLKFEVVCGDAAQGLLGLKRAVHCVMTSPPYFQKRKYGESDKEIGNEKDILLYISKLVSIFCSVPLHQRGSIWVNLGDKRGKNGNLMQVPHRFSIAMQDAGFLLADEVVWAKSVVFPDGTTRGNCMPEPAEHRLNGNGFETLYRFVKTPTVSDAWVDNCAVRIPRLLEKGKRQVWPIPDMRYLPKELMACETAIDGRSLQNVWQINSGQTSEAHWATYPTELCERPIAMTCPMFVNPDGYPRERIVKKIEYNEGRGKKRVFGKYNRASQKEKSGRQDTASCYTPRKPETKGWTMDEGEFEPGLVCDPFCGSGTTGMAALRLGRSFVGFDLYKENCDIAEKNCQNALVFMRDRNLNPFKRGQ